MSFKRHVGDDFVGVHVGRGAGAALQHVDHEMLVTIAGDDAIAGRDDGGGDVGLERAEIAVGHGAGLLDHGQRLHEFREVAYGNAGDGEILDRPRRLDAIIGIGRNLDSPIKSFSMRVAVMGLLASVPLTGAPFGGRLARFPAKWNRFAEKKSSQSICLEHVLIAKVRALWRNMLYVQTAKINKRYR